MLRTAGRMICLWKFGLRTSQVIQLAYDLVIVSLTLLISRLLFLFPHHSSSGVSLSVVKLKAESRDNRAVKVKEVGVYEDYI